ncbi:Ribonuclease P protein subunit p40 [Geranomyces variabilis]|uniref:Ribonuclease P protein subunit p40 n=1 Tax=Geranomyces variabilis TaxID=109894 RepID=A0AAD5TGZ4_9FUNG|nr:Ribonuclease P protein subunit p40 [Geranomyces variabilis]
MSVYPAFEQPSAKLHVAFQSFTKGINACKTHDFNNAIDVVIPAADPQPLAAEIAQCIDGCFYYRASLPLSYFLGDRVLSHIKAGNFMALRADAHIDTDDVFAILPSGVMVLNVGKDTYESLGLAGKESKLPADRGRRFVVRINMKSPDFHKKTKLWKRLEWCFSHTLVGTFDFWLARFDILSGKTTELLLTFPFNARPTRYPLSVTTSTQSSVSIPSLPLPSPFPSDCEFKTDQEAAREHAVDVFEWLGLAAHAAPRIAASDSIDPFYSVYSPPEPNAPGDLTTLSIRGFITPQHIEAIITRAAAAVDSDANGTPAWAAAMVWGFRDSPVSWREQEHGPFVGALGSTTQFFSLSQTQFISWSAIERADRIFIREPHLRAVVILIIGDSEIQLDSHFHSEEAGEGGVILRRMFKELAERNNLLAVESVESRLEELEKQMLCVWNAPGGPGYEAAKLEFEELRREKAAIQLK